MPVPCPVRTRYGYPGNDPENGPAYHKINVSRIYDGYVYQDQHLVRWTAKSLWVQLDRYKNPIRFRLRPNGVFTYDTLRIYP